MASTRRNQQRGDTGLAGYRALDLTDERGFLCGKMLADLGADVVKVEKPGGDPSRNLPFYHDEPDPEKSLLWWALNTSKRGITLDLVTRDGREIFLTLVKKADFVIESFQPGQLAKLGLGYEDMRNVNPGVIMISISGFGQGGPYAEYKAPDIVCAAMGGWMNLVGDPDRAPLRVTVPQSFLHASAEGVAGGLIALWHREMTGEGQWVDVSAQECMAWVGFQNQNLWDMSRVNLKRLGCQRVKGPVTIPSISRCKDGYIFFALFTGTQTRRHQRLVEWMEEEGMATILMKEIDWETFDPYTLAPERTLELRSSFDAFFLTKTKAELFQQALSRGLLLAPVNSIGDVFESIHLRARGFWQTIEHPEVRDRVVYPGAPYIAVDSPYRIRKRAPLIGEHNDDIFQGELGLSRNQIIILKAAGVI